MHISAIVIWFYRLDHTRVFLLVLVATILFAVCSRLLERFRCWKILMAIGTLAAAFLIIYVTVLQRTFGSTSKVILIPFHSYYEYFTGIQTEGLRTVLMNMALFAPVGLFLSELLPHKWKTSKKILVVAVCGFILSVSIEIVQFTFQCGEAETDDVINNTIGALLGGLCVILELWIYQIVKKVLSKLKT